MLLIILGNVTKAPLVTLALRNNSLIVTKFN